MRQLFTFFILLTFAGLASAQDARYTQFYAAPHHMNPAFTGVFDGGYRFVANYRELYNTIMARTAYRSVAASFDIRRPVSKGDFAGFGLSATRDQAGIAKFVNQYAHLSASFMKRMDESRYSTSAQYLITGAQIGYGQRGFDFNSLWFSNQFDTNLGVLDPGLTSGEPFDMSQARPTTSYLDFNAGVLWYSTFAENGSFYFGGAIYHLNEPNVSFIEGQEEPLSWRWVGQAGVEAPLNREMSLMPAVAVMSQGPNMSITAGGNVRYSHNEKGEIALRLGAWAHLANQLESGMLIDNVAVTAFLELERWNLGLSYDITTSALRQANNSRGGFEVSLIYVGKANYPQRLVCPNL